MRQRNDVDRRSLSVSNDPKEDAVKFFISEIRKDKNIAAKDLNKIIDFLVNTGYSVDSSFLEAAKRWKADTFPNLKKGKYSSESIRNLTLILDSAEQAANQFNKFTQERLIEKFIAFLRKYKYFDLDEKILTKLEKLQGHCEGFSFLDASLFTLQLQLSKRELPPETVYLDVRKKIEGTFSELVSWNEDDDLPAATQVKFNALIRIVYCAQHSLSEFGLARGEWEALFKKMLPDLMSFLNLPNVEKSIPGFQSPTGIPIFFTPENLNFVLKTIEQESKTTNSEVRDRVPDRKISDAKSEVSDVEIIRMSLSGHATLLYRIPTDDPEKFYFYFVDSNFGKAVLVNDEQMIYSLCLLAHSVGNLKSLNMTIFGSESLKDKLSAELRAENLLSQTDLRNLSDIQKADLFYNAIKIDNVNLAEFILEPPKILNQFPTGYSQLHYAAMYGRKKIAELLLDDEYDVNAKTKVSNRTPLHFAARFGRTKVAELLLTSKADINAKINHLAPKRGRCTPLHIALEFGQDEVAELLIRKKADLFATDKHGRTPLEFAKENSRIYNMILKQRMAWDNPHREDLPKMLILAAKEDDSEVARKLISLNVNKNVIVRGTEETVLHFAIREKRNKVAMILLKKGAEVKTHDHSNPLHIAIASGNQDIAKFLIGELKPNEKFKAYIDEANSSGLTPLHIAAQSNQLEIVRLLVERGAKNIDCLHLAGSAEIRNFLFCVKVARSIQEQVKDVVGLLNDKFGDVNTKLPDGNRLILLATRAGNIELVKALLDRNANVNDADQNGLTALHIAAANNNSKLVELLLKERANPSLKAANGKTPQEMASKEKVISVLKSNAANKYLYPGDQSSASLLLNQGMFSRSAGDEKNERLFTHRTIPSGPQK